jgi:hypothetical protein
MFEPSQAADYCEFRLFLGDELRKTIRVAGY